MEKKYSITFQIIVISFIALANLGFYRLKFLPENIIHLITFSSVIALIVLLITDLSFINSKVSISRNFNAPITIIFVSLILSMIIAAAFHHQPVHISIWANRYIFFFLTYYLLHILKPDKELIVKLIITLGVLNALFYLLQFFTYPTMLFNVRVGMERNTIRIFLPGMALMILTYFIVLNRLFSSIKASNILILLLIASVFILTGTRQIIFSILFITVMGILFSRIVKSKLLVLFFATIGMMFLFLAFNETFMALINVTQDQSTNFEEDIRIRAARYFLNDFSPNILARLFGNSESHMATAYGRNVQYLKIRHGFYQSDIGLIGDYTKYGILFVIACAMIFYKLFTAKTGAYAAYIKLFALYMLMTSVSGSSIFSTVDFSLIFAMYISDLEIYNRNTLLE